MTEQDPTPIKDEIAGDEAASDEAASEEVAGDKDVAASHPERRSASWLVPAISLAAIVLIGLMWWNERTTSAVPAPNADALDRADAPIVQSEARSPATQNRATPTALPATPTNTPVATAEAATAALPTVTPTLLPSSLPTRTVTFGGNTTLRLVLQNDSYASNGKPVDRAIEPRTYALGSQATTVADRWCMQLGVVSLLFDITFTLNPMNGAVKTTGTLNLHDGFCDAPGPQTTGSALDLEVPADASAEVVQSLQTESHMLGVSELLNIDTGVFVELVISNTRRQETQLPE